VGGDNEFFNLYVFRLDGNEAARRAALIAVLAGEVRSKRRPSGQALQARDIETTSANMNP
jgi:hypothetical protein